MANKGSRLTIRDRCVRSTPFRHSVWLTIGATFVLAIVARFTTSAEPNPWVMLLLGGSIGGLLGLCCSAITEELNDRDRLRVATSRINRLCTALAMQNDAMGELSERITSNRTPAGLTLYRSEVAGLIGELEESLSMIEWEIGSFLDGLFIRRTDKIEQLITQASILSTNERNERLAELTRFREFLPKACLAFQVFGQTVREPKVDLAALDQGAEELRVSLCGAFAECYPEQFDQVEAVVRECRTREVGTVASDDGLSAGA